MNVKRRIEKLEVKATEGVELFFASFAVTVDPATGNKRVVRCLCGGGSSIFREADESEASFMDRARSECIERYKAAGKAGVAAAWLDETELNL
jgi:hypothetical protein